MDGELRWAWLAGFWDGEGTIGIIREKRSANKSGYRYTCYMSIANTSLESMKAVADMLSISLDQIKLDNQAHLSKHPLHKPCYKITVRGRRVLLPIIKMLPYLVVKKRQAQVVIDLASCIEPRENYLFPEEEVAREKAWQETMELNKRGRKEDGSSGG